MNTTIKWPRFLIVSFVGALIMLALYAVYPNVVGTGIVPDYPSRPPEEAKALLPFLAVVSIVQLLVFCFLYMRVYPRRSLGNAIWFGLWCGFFMVLPDGQFFVVVPHTTWAQLLIGWGTGMLTTTLLMIFFHSVYRPRDENWTQPKVEWPRFLVFGALSALLVFALDIPFHQYLAPKLFTGYPAADFAQRPVEEVQALFPWLFLTYLLQLSFFCYVFLRVYPKRGMGSAIWFGAWAGVWVVIPNMQYFVGLDKYTWHMLAIQVPEGAILTMIMMAFFEWAYRPKIRA